MIAVSSSGPQHPPPRPPRDPGERAMRSRLMANLFGDTPEPVKIGRYVVLDRLGQGGVGVVYSAYDPHLDRRIALKLIRSGVAGPGVDLGVRLQREARVMAKLSHPNVVGVHDVGEDRHGVYIAMELVEGSVLSSWGRTGSPSWQTIRAVMLDAGAGLAAAHAVGLVHCDFKPGNVMVDASGRGRVLDFGLARAVTADVSHASDGSPRVEEMDPQSRAIGQTATIAGTPAYMAPEQYHGGAIDARVDQWAFCATLFEMLYGRRAFAGETIDQVRAAVMAGRVAERAKAHAVPRWLHAAMLRGLQVDPGLRWPTMRALMHELTRDQRSRRRLWVGAGATMALCGLSVAATLWLGAHRPTPEMDASIAAMVARAEAAAKQGCFVYPDPESPRGPSAYASVVALEHLAGPGAARARERGLGLRQQFALSLRRVADEYWGSASTRMFASDYYAHVLLFDPDDELARTRTGLTPGEVAGLRAAAQTGEFNAAQLRAGATLGVLADEDRTRRESRLRELVDSDGGGPALSTMINIDALLGETVSPVVEPEQPQPTGAEIESEHKRPSPGGPSGTPLRAQARDPRAATKLAATARKTAARGRYSAAEALFHRALGYDEQNVQALSGLADLYFERGAYKSALEFATRAVEQDPKSGALRMALGDALFKVLRYGDARKQYAAALDLGHADAQAALARVAHRLGTGD